MNVNIDMYTLSIYNLYVYNIKTSDSVTYFIDMHVTACVYNKFSEFFIKLKAWLRISLSSLQS